MRSSLLALSKASRRPLTAKMANKDYYKGTRQGALPGGPFTGPPGRHTRRGGYVIDDTKVRVFVSPPPQVLDASPLKPYVTRTTELSESQERKDLKGWKALKGRNYLKLITREQKQFAIETAKALPPLSEPQP